MTITSNHLLSRYLIGMPHLSAVGLSEQWLLKECGHQHWLALAQACGKLVPEFYDRRGNKVYAAFVCVEVNNARLDAVQENDELEMATELTRLSASRNISSHVIMKADRVVARVMMLSTFVYREECGNNQSVAKTEIVMSASADNPSLSAPAFLLLKQHKQLRHYQPAIVGRFIYQPCPYSDFNGADFLYFAAFQQVADRAEQAFISEMGNHASLWITQRRSLFYYGNINIGDSLIVELSSYTMKANTMAVEMRIKRNSDGFVLMDIIYQKSQAVLAKQLPMYRKEA